MVGRKTNIFPVLTSKTIIWIDFQDVFFSLIVALKLNLIIEDVAKISTNNSKTVGSFSEIQISLLEKF